MEQWSLDVDHILRDYRKERLSYSGSFFCTILVDGVANPATSTPFALANDAEDNSETSSDGVSLLPALRGKWSAYTDGHRSTKTRQIFGLHCQLHIWSFDLACADQLEQELHGRRVTVAGADDRNDKTKFFPSVSECQDLESASSAHEATLAASTIPTCRHMLSTRS